MPEPELEIAQGGPAPLKIAFIGLYNLFDSANGAGLSLRTLLEQLARRGHQCRALTACCFDAPPGASLAHVLGDAGLAPTGRIVEADLPIWQGTIAGVTIDAVQLATQTRNLCTALEEMLFRDTARLWLAQHKPDVVLVYGGFLLEHELQRCAHAAGARVAFYLANPNYLRPETFAHADLVLANSRATSEHYRRTLGLASHPIGLFADPAPSIAARSGERCITFINPLPEKGVTLFLKLVQRAAREAPDMRFLVVDSRGALATAVQRLALPPDQLAAVTVLPQQQRMAAVYARTRILLMPSFWFEGAGRVLIEANANGIPVIAADSGGIPETLAGAGRLLPVPPRCRQDFWTLPTDEEAAPWWDELQKLWRDEAHWDTLSRAALEAARGQDLAQKAREVEGLLRRLTGR